MAFISILQSLVHCKAPLDCLRAGVLQPIVPCKAPLDRLRATEEVGGRLFFVELRLDVSRRAPGAYQLSPTPPWALLLQTCKLFHIPSDFMVESCSTSLKSPRGEDLQIEKPVFSRDFPSFDFYSTCAGMLGATLVGDEIVQVRQSCEKHLLASFGMMERFHHTEFPLDGVMRLIEQGAGDGHTRVCKHRIPAGLLLLEPVPYTRAVGRPRRGGDVVGKVAEPLPQRKHPQALPLARPVEPGMEQRAQGFADRGRDGREFLRERGERVTEAIPEACPCKQRPHALDGAVEAIGEDPSDSIGRLLLERRALKRPIGLGRPPHWPPQCTPEARSHGHRQWCGDIPSR
jgi:hypothetical protein